MNKKILITGAGGYIGSRMVELYLKEGNDIVALDRYFFGDNLNDLKSDKLSIVQKDVRNLDPSIFKGVDVVIDLASISNDPASELIPNITQSINHNGAFNVAKIAKESGVKKFIFSSSCSMYGSGDGILTEESDLAPISTYAKSKIAAENDMLKLADNNFSVTFLRNATVYGLSIRRMRFDLIINIMTLHAWKNNRILVMGGGKQWRPLVHVDDLIKAFYTVVKEEDINKINKEAFNVGSNEQNYQVYQVANMFKKHFNDLKIEVIPDDPDLRNYHVNFDKISNTLGFKVDKSIDDGILEIRDALERGLIDDDIKTKTVEYYKYLINADEILKKVKIEGNLF